LSGSLQSWTAMGEAGFVGPQFELLRADGADFDGTACGFILTENDLFWVAALHHVKPPRHSPLY